MNRLKKLLPALILLIALTVYLLTICPTVYVGDSGEIITAVYHLGIAHPPGYPLYCMLGKIFTYLPLGTIAFRVNLLAAFFAGLTACLLFLTGKLLLPKMLYPPFFAASASLAFAFSKTFWSQSLMAKGGLYTLNTFLIITAVFILLLIYKNASGFPRKLVILLAVISGMGLAHHHTFAPISVVFLVFLLWISATKEKNCALKAGALFLSLSIPLALLLYMYLPIRSSSNPVIDWGHPATFYGFLNHALRKQYSEVTVASRSLSLLFSQIGYYVKSFSAQFTVIPALICVLGLFRSFKHGLKPALLLLSVFLATSLGFIAINNYNITSYDLYVIEVFFIPSYLVAGIWLLFGLEFILSAVKRLSAQVALSAASLLLVMLPLSINYFESDRSRNTFAYDYGVNILKTPEKNSLLFLSGDNQVFIPAYLNMTEGLRPDLSIADDYGRVFKNIYGSDFLTMPTGVYQKRVNEVQRHIVNNAKTPVYCNSGSALGNMDDFRFVTEGLLYRVSSLKLPAKPVAYTLRGMDDTTIYKDYFVRELIGQHCIAVAEAYAASGLKEKALAEYSKANEFCKDNAVIQSSVGNALGRFSPEASANHYLKSISSGVISSEIYNNLGTAYYRSEKIDESVKAYQKALELDPSYYKSYFNLGVSYLKKQDFDNADKSFIKSLELNPTYTDAYYALGNSAFFRNKFEDALKYYSRTVEINPGFSTGWNAVAASYHSLNRLDEAILAYKKALLLKPDYTDAAGNLSSAFIAKGDRNSAVKVLEDCLRLLPEDARLRQLRNNLK